MVLMVNHNAEVRTVAAQRGWQEDNSLSISRLYPVESRRPPVGTRTREYKRVN